MSQIPPAGPPGPDPYGHQPSGQTPYGAAQSSPYGARADHPQATMILILGILSLVACQVLGPIAWVMGNRALAEIDAANGTIGGRANVNVGRILGIVGSVLLILSVLFLVLFVVLALAPIAFV